MEAALQSAEQTVLEFERIWKEDRKWVNRLDMSMKEWVWRQDYPLSFLSHFASVGVERTSNLSLVPLWRVQSMVEVMKRECVEEEQRIIEDISELIEWGRDWNHQMAVMKMLDDEVWTDEEEEDTASESATSVSASTVPTLTATTSTSTMGSFCSSSSSKKKKMRKSINSMFKRKRKSSFEKRWYKMPGSNVQNSPPPEMPHAWKY